MRNNKLTIIDDTNFTPVRLEEFFKYKSWGTCTYEGWEVGFVDGEIRGSKRLVVRNRQTKQVLAITNFALHFFEKLIEESYQEGLSDGLKKGHREAGKLVMGK